MAMAEKLGGNTVLVEFDEGIAWVTLNRPEKRNAMSPTLNKEMTEAESITGKAARATAWAKIDEHIVEKALSIPFDWDKQANIEGSTVKGVGDLWDVGEWDYSWTSLK